MNQIKIYSILVTAILVLWWPAWYFFTTGDMIKEIQQKDDKIVKALKTLKKAKASIEKKDGFILTQSWVIKTCNWSLAKKEEEIKSLKADLENAYAWISDDIISTESVSIDKKDKNKLDWWLNKWLIWTWEVIKNNIIKTNKTDDLNKILVLKNKIKDLQNQITKKSDCKSSWWAKIVSSWNNFDEKNELETMDLAYNRWFWKRWLQYLRADSKSLLEMYKWNDEVLKEKILYYCSDDLLEKKYYWKFEKARVRSYIRSYCKDEKYENCSADIKKKIDKLKSDENIISTSVVRILTKYNPEKTSEIKQELFAAYDDFWKRVCSWKVTISKSWKKSYLQVR